MTSEVSNKTGENVLVSYTYDDNGNLQSQLDVNSTAAVHHSYNGFNQLVSSVTGEGTITYTYNAQGIRTSRTVGLTTTHYLLDGGNVIGEVTEDETYTYVRGVNLIFGRARYYLYNAHGDVVQLTNTNGQLTKNYNYDAFGNERSPSEEDTNPFRYCGEYYDTETGLYYLRARYYDPLIGRFTQEDTHWNTANMIYGDNPQKINEREDALGLKTYSFAPELLSILQAGNLYVYCINNPVDLGDYSGNKAKPLAFNEGVFSLLRTTLVGGFCIAVAMVINPPPPIPIKGKQASYTPKKPQEEAIAASPASPLPPDDDDENIIPQKIRDQMARRGWTEESINDVIDNPHTTRIAENKANGNPATAYYNKAGDYVVRDNITGEIIQISRMGDTAWIPDSTIIDPFFP